MTAMLLEAQNLNFAYGRQRVLKGLSLNVARGSLVALVGRNGAGKTTFFNVISGLLNIQDGQILIQGKPLKGYRRQGGRIGLLPQNVTFYRDRTLLNQMLFLARLSGLSGQMAHREVMHLLEQVDLLDYVHRSPDCLSGGMLIRLGLAQALLGVPPLVLLDEPTAGLDPVAKSAVYDLIRTFSNETTFIISSHQLEELETFCDHVCIIDDGVNRHASPMRSFLSETSEIHLKVRMPNDLLTALKQAFPDCDFTWEQKRDMLSIRGRERLVTQADLRCILPWLLEREVDMISLQTQTTLWEKFLKTIES